MNQFSEKKYIPVKNLIERDLVDVASQYALLDELNNFTTEDELFDKIQVPNTHVNYGDILMESILLHIKPKIETVTELNLLPTYSFFRVYRNGSDLKPHYDRPACEVSVTISFNFNYQEKSSSLKWPMFIDNTPISLNPGDGIIYRGCEVRHWREPLIAPDYSYHVQGFFHFVNKNGPYAAENLDGRNYIGEQMHSRKVSNKSYISNIN